jgi:hypothetical protein
VTLQDIGVMESDEDVNEIANCLASCTVADECVNLGTVTIKKLQGLIIWIKDNTIRGQELDADNFMAAVLSESMTTIKEAHYLVILIFFLKCTKFCPF